MASRPGAQQWSLSRRLIYSFFAWKFVLLIVAAFSPGPGYDTSALIALNPSSLRHNDFKSWSRADRLSLNLFRWDALYFAKSAQRGYLYEQEWAFSWAYSLIIKLLVKSLKLDAEDSLRRYVWAGIAVSNICHLLSVLTLFRLFNVLLGHQQNGRLPFIGAVLHIVSPAGMFLSSPYAEALFALLNFAGMLLYAQAKIPGGPDVKQTIREDALVLSASILFTLATWVRSNGLLSGLLFMFDLISRLPKLWGMKLSKADARRIAVTCVSGILLGLGFILPQYVAYQEYCTFKPDARTRPWCHKTIPSIYAWVQSNYWNVGFLRYWTPSNLPLFIMATPMLWLLLQSSVEHLRYPTQQTVEHSHSHPRGEGRNTKPSNATFGTLPQLALPQLVLAITAATNFHVQVINRLCSGYPIWYLSTARWSVAQNTAQRNMNAYQIAQWAYRGLIVYGIVQGALYANFLPPA